MLGLLGALLVAGGVVGGLAARSVMARINRINALADRVAEAAAVAAPPLRLSEAPKWAVLLDAPWADEYWYRNVLGQDWLDKGVADERSAQAALLADLNAHAAQLLLGVRAASVPDRGVLRQLDALAQAAQGGVVVQLLADSAQTGSGSLNDTLAQWHSALQARQIAWLDPAAHAQQQRLPENTVAESQS